MSNRGFSDQHFSYQQLSFSDFTAQFQGSMPKARLFELSLPWLEATQAFMLELTDKVVVHCLFDYEQTLLMAWPLVHQQNSKQIKSLSSFYSAITEPIYCAQSDVKQREYYCTELLSFIDRAFIEKTCLDKILTKKESQWQSMQLGSFDQNSAIAKAIVSYFPAHKVFSQTDNVYQAKLTDFEVYYQQRPSQLRNTIKRRSKKLARDHQYEITIITKRADFALAFEQYKTIYQQSWKGEEYSFSFIEQVCLAALRENKLRLGLLYIDGEAAAAQIWFVQDCLSESNQFEGNQFEGNQAEKHVSIFKLAYKPKYQQYSTGSLLSMALSEHVISQDKATSIEFGMGSEPYKSDWLADKRQRVSYQVFNQDSFYGKLAAIRHIHLAQIRSKMTNLLAK
jgi:hypothetical protein